MTVYEHLMVGGSLALAGGCHYRYGWRIVGLAAFASALPDWDGLSLLFGSQAYSQVHRVWGHNLLVALGLGGLAGGLEYRFHLAARIGRALARVVPRWRSSFAAGVVASKWSLAGGVEWIGLGIVASFSHLVADFFYSGHPGMTVWPLPLLWPFSDQAWAFPVVSYGDLGATLILVVEMFALYRWPRHARWIACLGLAAVSAYVFVRWALNP